MRVVVEAMVNLQKIEQGIRGSCYRGYGSDTGVTWDLRFFFLENALFSS
jgi:hypothetical protein